MKSYKINFTPNNIDEVNMRVSNTAQDDIGGDGDINRRGNTVGNIINGGFVAQQDEWIYYRNGGEGGKLYKIRMDGSDRTKITGDESCYINVAGEWVYYSNERAGYKLYKIRIDGSGKTKFYNGKTAYINVVGDWVYYSNGSDDEKLYKLYIDGSGRTKLNDDKSRYINVVGEWAYYSNYSDGNKLYKIRIDGSGRTKLNDDRSYSINVVGEWVYYSNYSDGSKLYKIRIDGSGKTKFDDDKSDYINAVGDWVYYCNYSDGSKLYKIRIDGSGKTKLNDSCSYSINMVGDWVYYQNNRFYSGKLSKIHVDGSSGTKINDDESHFIEHTKEYNMDKIELVETDFLKSSDADHVFDEIIDKKAHYISWAIPGLTFSAFFCEMALKNSNDNSSYQDLFMKINYKQETGTLYPYANMTFLPMESENYGYLAEHSIVHHRGYYTRKERTAHFKDAFIANRDYIKASKIYVDCRDIEHNFAHHYNSGLYWGFCPCNFYSSIRAILRVDIVYKEKFDDVNKIVIIHGENECKRKLGCKNALGTDKCIFSKERVNNTV